MHLKDNMYVVHCGPGSQKIRWLGDVAIHRHDQSCAMETGLMAEIRFENGVQLNVEGMISEELTDDVHLYVILLGKVRHSIVTWVCSIEDLIKMEESKQRKKK